LPPPLTEWLATTRPASIVAALIRPRSRVWRPYSPKATKLPRVALPLTRPFWLFRDLTRLGIMGIGAALHFLVIPLVDPHFDSDLARRRLGLGEAVVDLGAEAAQGHRAQAGRLGPGHFRAAEPSRQLDLDPARPAVHGLLQRAFHGPAEAGALLELLG